MLKTLFVNLILVCTCSLFAQSKIDEGRQILYKDIKAHLSQGINYLESSQRKTTKEGRYYQGEWQNSMSLRMSYFYLGTKKAIDDSNCFSVASIHNSLANIYLAYPEYEKIPKMLDLSFNRIMSYRNGNKFNFWNLLPPTRKLKKGDIIGQQPLVRRPTNYRLKSKYIHNAANVTEDADDTSLAYTAIALRKKYKPEANKRAVYSIDSISPIFEKHKDINRKNRHWYNYINGNDHDTGAYLTWLDDEFEFEEWSVLKVIGHNATFFLPISECFPHPYIPYIPYGTNDLDGVVNANVLSALAHYDELNAPGVPNAIRFIEKKCKRKKYDRVGIYYPNRYHFPYAVSKAYANGVTQLEGSTKYLLDYLIDSQNNDGSWSARRILNKKDKLQSTAYALNALNFIGRYEDRNVTIAIEKGIRYLLKYAITEDDLTHWEGGVFFSGGTVVRNILWWKSDAYTTAIILNAFANYRRHLEETYEFNSTN